ncbi:hypothetical protein DQ04_00451020 [Trypanosoma grayi]|uniref:hypothetical protein n=1 Tax=Trypanosoma grayi TaxID=71804 RepID=UPI0004F48A83|nr:hypothetical protein DQ04_00451020 [Trypanosoma grayi]KEG14463.1 hypothetical protein DQ04_00451020 [Trypanosoma grayi]
MSRVAATAARCTRRIRAPLDHLIMRPSDPDQVATAIRTTDAAIVTWYMPLESLQHVLHRRYEAEQFGELLVSPPPGGAGAAASSSSPKSGEEAAAEPTASEENKPVPLGLVTLIAGRNYPAQQTWLERCFDPAPHSTLTLRVSVMDRIHWQRTAWMANSICRSICWGRLPQKIFAINLDWKNEVCIDGIFDASENRYTTPYELRVPGLDFHLTLQDTGKTLFDPNTRVVDGFLDNESALHRLSLAREVNMQGLGGSVYRQMLWSTPSLPNTATVLRFNPGTLFQRCFGADPPVATPVSAWLVQEVEKTLLYKMEGEVEDENDPNSATTYGDRSLTERVQKKAMNRYNGFRDEVRGKVYSDIDGKELPR